MGGNRGMVGRRTGEEEESRIRKKGWEEEEGRSNEENEVNRQARRGRERRRWEEGIGGEHSTISVKMKGIVGASLCMCTQWPSPQDFHSLRHC